MFSKLRKFFKGDIPPVYKVVKPQGYVPFKLVIGGHVKFDTIAPIVYKSICQLPSSRIVSSIGKFNIGDAKVFRIYIGDYHFLQVITNQKNQIEECRLFFKYDTIYPSTADSWRGWIGENIGKLGYYDFHLDILDTTQFTFSRMSSWAEDGPDWVPPITFTETIENATSEPTEIIHQAMAYGRWLNEDKKVAEYLIASSDSSKVEEVIQLYVGIDINPHEVQAYFQ